MMLIKYGKKEYIKKLYEALPEWHSYIIQRSEKNYGDQLQKQTICNFSKNPSFYSFGRFLMKSFLRLSDDFSTIFGY